MENKIDYSIFKGIFSFDIETAPQEPDYNKLSESQKAIWHNRYIVRNTKKYADEYDKPENNLKGKYNAECSFFPDFSQVVCISISPIYSRITKGYNTNALSFTCVKHKTWQENEKEILEDFASFLTRARPTSLLGMNINAFDIPFLQKKYIFHNLDMPVILKKSYTKSNGILKTQKPWNIDDMYLDLMWLFKGMSREFNSLNDICLFLNIPSPKGSIDGSQVSEYYFAGKIKEITTYCEADVDASKKVYLKLYNSF